MSRLTSHRTQEQQDERAPLLASTTSRSKSRHTPSASYGGSSSSRIIISPIPVTAQDQEESTAPPTSAQHADLDARFKRWVDEVRKKMAHAGRRSKEAAEPEWLVSVFEATEGEGALVGAEVDVDAGGQSGVTKEMLKRQIAAARSAIESGLYPKMIATGSSGSYFVRVRDAEGILSGVPVAPAGSRDKVETVAVFKPKDEEPYGNLNPKRQFLRTYFWWAMGRPCLIPNFSYLSEVGSSLLDERLGLHLVPRTALVGLSSPTFHYRYMDRLAWERDGKPLPEKIGSYQTFLKGYSNASDFLRAHPWPSRPRNLLERDLAAEQRAHKLSRGRQKARVRNCYVGLKHFVLCRRGFGESEEDEWEAENDRRQQEAEMDLEAAAAAEEGFVWTAELRQSFRLELEKLVCFDFLQRNTDRGLDNFMLKEVRDPETGRASLRLGAIDNSLSFPWKHPVGIRSYPYGWLYLPTDLIGGPFSEQTRQLLIPKLNDAKWWLETQRELRGLFEKDEYFDHKLFKRQMEVLKGQGWNLLQSLRSPDEGPIELCARTKQVVLSSTVTETLGKVFGMPGSKVPLHPSGTVATSASAADTEAARPGASVDTKHQATMPLSASLATVGPRSTAHSVAVKVQSGSSDPFGAHPRSLPETNKPWPDVLAGQGEGEGQGQGGREYQGTLGIDVLAEFDRVARKARRPTLRKALTGVTGSSAGNSPSKATGTGTGTVGQRRHEGEAGERDAPLASDAMVRAISRSPQRARKVSVGGRGGHTKGKSTGEGSIVVGQARKKAGSVASRLELGNDGQQRDSIEATLAKAATVADPEATRLPSKEGLVMADEETIDAGVDDEGEEEEEEEEGMEESVADLAASTTTTRDWDATTGAASAQHQGRMLASLPCLPVRGPEVVEEGARTDETGHAVAAADGQASASASATASPPPAGTTNRRRMGSVGQWSIRSLVWDRDRDRDGNRDRERERGTPRQAEDQRVVRAIVERCEADEGVAWQTWLGLQ